MQEWRGRSVAYDGEGGNGMVYAVKVKRKKMKKLKQEQTSS